ncbi:BREX-2 system ATPase PglY [Actinospica robiniae]|uniref:BREX-2 system ATPase PglY n=1 Tax=Actinospica robiniae TaxID=304901 RepID=UPI0003FD653F|nr:hypothetical protein [Actinospica robiniae]
MPVRQPLLREVIDIPERVDAGNLVLKLTEALRDEESLREALGDYVVTDKLVDNFGEGLDLIKSALDSGKSKAAYLHGSFGSGKSHYMAVLYALLRNLPDARAIDAFAPLLRRHDDWLGTKEFLVVPLHMLGAKSIEQRVLGGYVEHVRKIRPDAPIPQVYRTDALFDNVRQMRARLGDVDFIKGLSDEGAAEAFDDEWGDDAWAWTPERLDIALSASQSDSLDTLDLVNPTSPEELRAKLVTDMQLTYAPGFFSNAREDETGFIPLDRGLSVISAHAKELGFDALVLFVDEIVLWLAQSIQDEKFVGREAGKITNFVEGSGAVRPIPVISLLARQRDLRELVGDELSAGAAEVSIQDTLKLAAGRFTQITLADTNLPEIASKRLLKPKGGHEAEMAAAFQSIKRIQPAVWDALLGDNGSSTTGADEKSFQQSYPFTPAFMDTLVRISDSLMRSRTALKLIQQILVEQRETAKLGNIIPLGDLYDVISRSGDEPFMEDLKAEFHKAQAFYRQEVTPYLLGEHQLTQEDVERYLRSPQDVVPELARRAEQYRTDNRLIGTLLLSSLAPAVPAFQNLTVRRLTALNHGVVASPLPGLESGIVQEKLARWAVALPGIRVSDGESDKVVSLKLVTVDYKSVLTKAAGANNAQNRRSLMERLVREELGLKEAKGDRAIVDTLDLVWRGSARSVEVVFGNIFDPASLADGQFAPMEPDRWRFVIDLPYDEKGNGPADDRSRAYGMKELLGSDTRTVCWIPAHMTRERFREFEELTVIDYVLAGQRFESNASHLSPDDRVRARTELENQKSALLDRVRKVLKQAYGQADRTTSDVDDYDDHLVPLTTVALKRPMGLNLDEALRALAGQLLARQFSKHPDLGPDLVRDADIRAVAGFIRKAAENQETPNLAEVPTRAERDLMRRIADRLGIGTVNESYFTLGTHWVDEFEPKAKQAGGALQVAAMRSWIDADGDYGLDPKVANLILAAYAERTDRVWYHHGGLAELTDVTKLNADWTLRAQPLPSPEDWDEARVRSETIFGMRPTPKLRRARIVAQFAKVLTAEVAKYQGPAIALAQSLELHARDLGLDTTASSGRLNTARRAVEMLKSLSQDAIGPVTLVEALANADLGGPAERLGKSIRSAHEVASAIQGTAWDFLKFARDLDEPFDLEAAEIFSTLGSAANADEMTNPIAPVLDRTRRDVRALLERVNNAKRQPQPKPPTHGTDGQGGGQSKPTIDIGTSGHDFPDTGKPAGRGPESSGASGRSGSRSYAARKLVSQAESELAELLAFAKAHPNAQIKVTWEVVE